MNINFRVNEFEVFGNGDSIVAAYNTNEKPKGILVGKSGNAVLLCDGTKLAVVSFPRSEGSIDDVYPAHVPHVDLKWAF
jgi:hypothetical protein